MKQPEAGNVVPTSKFISPDELIQRLSSLCEQRLYALRAYPNQVNAIKKFDSIYTIRYWLKQAKPSSIREKIIICLHLENHFHTIAPHSSWEKFNKWWGEVDGMMNACRAFLGRRKQS
ncbi:MAG: hypothetical protein WBP45_12570 [Daejeonella sp.]